MLTPCAGLDVVLVQVVRDRLKRHARGSLCGGPVDYGLQQFARPSQPAPTRPRTATQPSYVGRSARVVLGQVAMLLVSIRPPAVVMSKSAR